MITTCTRCGSLFETTTEEADAPRRVCIKCYRRGVRLDTTTAANARVIARLNLRDGTPRADAEHAVSLFLRALDFQGDVEREAELIVEEVQLARANATPPNPTKPEQTQ